MENFFYQLEYRFWTDNLTEKHWKLQLLGSYTLYRNDQSILINFFGAEYRVILTVCREMVQFWCSDLGLIYVLSGKVPNIQFWWRYLGFYYVVSGKRPTCTVLMNGCFFTFLLTNLSRTSFLAQFRSWFMLCQEKSQIYKFWCRD